MGVRVITDSTAYLPAEDAERYGIGVVSLSVAFGEESYRELDIDPEWFYERVSAAKVLPTSAAPAPAEFLDLFGQAIDSGDDVVGVFLSSNMSGTLQAARVARGLALERSSNAEIELVDSRSNCMQLGMCALAAARAAEAGADAASAARAARETTERTRFLFVPDTLEYLRKGGRIGGASALLGGILEIRPVLTVADGETTVYSKVRTKRRALEEIVRVVERDAAQCGFEDAVVHHIHDEPEGRRMAEMLSEVAGQAVPLVPIGPVIGLHVGPGAVGVVYRTSQPLPPVSGQTPARCPAGAA